MSEFKVGDRVRILDDKSWGGWVSKMDATIGEVGEIEERVSSTYAVRLPDRQYWSYRIKALELAEKLYRPTRVQEIKDGMKVLVDIKGRGNVEGIITFEDGQLYVCQDIYQGAPCIDKKGKKYNARLCGSVSYKANKKISAVDNQTIKSLRIIETEEKELKPSDLKDGMHVVATIKDPGEIFKDVSCIVSIDECEGIFLCQNEAKGRPTSDKKGKEYSWKIANTDDIIDDELDLEYWGIKSLRIIKPAPPEEKETAVSYPLEKLGMEYVVRVVNEAELAQVLRICEASGRDCHRFDTLPQMKKVLKGNGEYGIRINTKTQAVIISGRIAGYTKRGYRPVSIDTFLKDINGLRESVTSLNEMFVNASEAVEASIKLRLNTEWRDLGDLPTSSKEETLVPVINI